jgi:hypothetical protein
MFVLASCLVVGMSSLRGIDARKLKIIGSLVVGGLLASLKSFETVYKRFAEAPKESEIARDLFNTAASAMASDHPFGVGINLYSYALEHDGYAERFNIEAGDRAGIAHHMYWLTAAEAGYIGLACYLLLLASVLVGAARLVRDRGPMGEISVGILAGLTVTYTQGMAEWILRQTPMSYCFWLFAAMVSAFLARRELVRRYLPASTVPKSSAVVAAQGIHGRWSSL